MSNKRFAVVVLTDALSAAGLDQEAVAKAVGGDLIDATEASLTLSVADQDAQETAVNALVAKGLERGANVFPVTAEVPDWLEEYREVADSMSEHGG